MKIRKYETGTWGTCYNIKTAINIISITPDRVCLMVDDENCGVLNFPFQEYNISHTQYNLLEQAARSGDVNKVKSIVDNFNSQSL